MGFVYRFARLFATTLLVSSSFVGRPQAAPTETILYNFILPVGSEPGDVIVGRSGNLYGSAYTGGLDGCSYYGRCGTIFELVPPSGARTAWAGRPIYSFKNLADGVRPTGSLIAGADGTLYGVAGGGAHGRGIVFSLTPPTSAGKVWIKRTLFDFPAGVRGSDPHGGLAIDGTGVLYGTTLAGGDSTCPDDPHDGCGLVFKLVPPKSGGTAWTEMILHVFAGGTDGAFPTSDLTLTDDGALYGTTSGFPSDDRTAARYSTAFKLKPPAAGTRDWTMQVLHDFDLRDAAAFGPLLVASDGTVTGTTSPTRASGACVSKADPVYGCGTVYLLAPPPPGATTATFTILHTFTAIATGIYPGGGVIQGPDGSLFGAASGGPPPCKCGIVYRLVPPASGQAQWRSIILHGFAGKPDGVYPGRPVLEPDRSLMGTTGTGGTGGCDTCGGLGTLYRIVQ